VPGALPRKCRKQLSEDDELLQFADENPHMVHHVTWVMKDPLTPGIMRDPIAPEAALFPEKTVLSTEPPPEQPSDPRRDATWAEIQTRFSNVEQPSTLPPYRFVNGICTLKEGCTVPPRCGVGRLSQEEITYTRAILTDYLHKGWIRPSYSRTAARLVFVTKPNGGLRSVVNYRALDDVLETQYFPPPERSNIVNQLGDSSLYSTFDCSDFFFQNRPRDEDSWLTAFSTCFGQFEVKSLSSGTGIEPGGGTATVQWHHAVAAVCQRKAGIPGIRLVLSVRDGGAGAAPLRTKYAVYEGSLQLPRPCAVRRRGRCPTGKSRCLCTFGGTFRNSAITLPLWPR